MFAAKQFLHYKPTTMADATAAQPPSCDVSDGGDATGGPRRFPDDFPELKGCRDAKVLAAAIKGAADSLTSVDLSGGACVV